jgi:hypothetical protein
LAGGTDPTISVIVVTETYSECLSWTLACLAGQSIAAELECILVTRRGSELAQATSLVREFHSLRIIEQEALDDAGRAKAMGVWAAAAPLVAFVEDHSYPDPSWAEALVSAYARGPFAAVGPVVLNANPVNGTSWGCHLVYYGMYMQACSGEHVAHLPGNQSSYLRDVLLEFGSRLPDMLQAEIALHGQLATRGMCLHQEADAKIYHLNYSGIGPAVREYFLASRVFAAERRRHWSLARRAVYTCGSPLLPFVRLKRVLGQARQAELPPRVVAGAAWSAWLILCAGAAGEFLGYSLGPGDARAALMRFEREHAGLFTAADLAEVALRRLASVDLIRNRS